MNDDERTKEALFRHAVLGDVLSRKLKWGELLPLLTELSEKTFEDYRGRPRRMAYGTLEEWFYKHRQNGFEGLKPLSRSDEGCSRRLSSELEQLVIDLKREDPGRSAPLILRELELAGRINRGEMSVYPIQRLLRHHGLSGPRMELDVPARFRWQASMCGELWQADALHGPKLINPVAGRSQRAIIFGLLDDRSRIIPYLEAGFGETEHRFITVLYNAIARRGIPRRLLLDNHASFTGHDLRLLCAKLDIHLVHSRPGDAPTKGKIERFWRSLRGHVVDRLDPKKVTTIDELNLRLWSFVEAEYHCRPHASHSGKTPLEVWEGDAGDIRWVSDHGLFEKAFFGEAERLARNDSTVQWRGIFYEVPPYLRRCKVRLRYSLLDTSRVSLLDANIEIPLRAVTPVDNAHRSRNVAKPSASADKPRTGLNAPDLMLENMIHPGPEPDEDSPANSELDDKDPEGGRHE
jgi:transposase InsO family protein